MYIIKKLCNGFKTWTLFSCVKSMSLLIIALKKKLYLCPVVLNTIFIYWLIVHNNGLLFTYDIASLCLESASLACDTLQLGSWSIWSLLSSLTNKFKWRTQGSEENKMSINMVSSVETLHRFFEDTSTVSSLLTDTLISRLIYFWTLFSIPPFTPFFLIK